MHERRLDYTTTNLLCVVSNPIGKRRNQTLLHCCSGEGNLQLAELVLKMLVDLNVPIRDLLTATDGDGKSPLHTACESGHINLVRRLCEHGADPTCPARFLPELVLLRGEASVSSATVSARASEDGSHVEAAKGFVAGVPTLGVWRPDGEFRGGGRFFFEVHVIEQIVSGAQPEQKDGASVTADNAANDEGAHKPKKKVAAKKDKAAETACAQRVPSARLSLGWAAAEDADNEEDGSVGTQEKASASHYTLGDKGFGASAAAKGKASAGLMLFDDEQQAKVMIKHSTDNDVLEQTPEVILRRTGFDEGGKLRSPHQAAFEDLNFFEIQVGAPVRALREGAWWEGRVNKLSKREVKDPSGSTFGMISRNMTKFKKSLSSGTSDSSAGPSERSIKPRDLSHEDKVQLRLNRTFELRGEGLGKRYRAEAEAELRVTREAGSAYFLGVAIDATNAPLFQTFYAVNGDWQIGGALLSDQSLCPTLAGWDCDGSTIKVNLGSTKFKYPPPADLGAKVSTKLSLAEPPAEAPKGWAPSGGSSGDKNYDVPASVDENGAPFEPIANAATGDIAILAAAAHDQTDVVQALLETYPWPPGKKFEFEQKVKMGIVWDEQGRVAAVEPESEAADLAIGLGWRAKRLTHGETTLSDPTAEQLRDGTMLAAKRVIEFDSVLGKYDLHHGDRQSQRTLLHHAARCGDLGLVKLLLNKASELDEASAQSDASEMCTLLLARDAERQTAILLAAMHDTAASSTRVIPFKKQAEATGEVAKQVLFTTTSVGDTIVSNLPFEMSPWGRVTQVLNENDSWEVKVGWRLLRIKSVDVHPLSTLMVRLERARLLNKKQINAMGSEAGNPLCTNIANVLRKVLSLPANERCDVVFECQSAHREIVTLLYEKLREINKDDTLGLGDEKAGLVDAKGHTPLHLAAMGDLAPMCWHLLELSDCDMDDREREVKRGMYRRTAERKTAIHLAAEGGCSAALAALLDAQFRYEKGNRPVFGGTEAAEAKDDALELDGSPTPIALAALHGHVDAMKALFEDARHSLNIANRKNDFNKPDRFGALLGMRHQNLGLETHASRRAPDNKIVDLMAVFRSGGKIVDVKLDGREVVSGTPLHDAVLGGSYATVKLLVDNESKIDRDKKEFSKDPKSMARSWKEESKWTPLAHRADDNGRTPLHLAALHSRHDLVDLLVVLRELYDPSTSQSSESGGSKKRASRRASVMHNARAATVGGRIRVSNVDLVDATGRSALHMAAERGDSQMIDALRSKGASFVLENRHARSPLHIAAMNGHLAATRSLLRLAANNGYKTVYSLDQPDRYGRTPLFLAARKQHDDVVAILLSEGKDVDKRRAGASNDLAEGSDQSLRKARNEHKNQMESRSYARGDAELLLNDMIRRILGEQVTNVESMLSSRDVPVLLPEPFVAELLRVYEVFVAKVAVKFPQLSEGMWAWGAGAYVFEYQEENYEFRGHFDQTKITADDANIEWNAWEAKAKEEVGENFFEREWLDFIEKDFDEHESVPPFHLLMALFESTAHRSGNRDGASSGALSGVVTPEMLASFAEGFVEALVGDGQLLAQLDTAAVAVSETLASQRRKSTIAPRRASTLNASVVDELADDYGDDGPSREEKERAMQDALKQIRALIKALGAGISWTKRSVGEALPDLAESLLAAFAPGPISTTACQFVAQPMPFKTVHHEHLVCRRTKGDHGCDICGEEFTVARCFQG